jgi:hypothetical protein
VIARRWIGLAAVCAGAAIAGCSAVLGMDAPQLDPCEDGGCVDVGLLPVEAAPDVPEAGDAGVDASREADVPEAAIDAGKDQGAPSGFRCGGGPSGQTYCNIATQVCCLDSDDAGMPTFTCTAPSACAGYPIGCSNQNDCPGSDVCCHYSSETRCQNPSSCARANLVCDPDASDSCPSGSTCTVQVIDNGQLVPYLSCSP